MRVYFVLTFLGIIEMMQISALFLNPTNRKAIDCKLTHWGVWGACKFYNNNDKMQKIRKRFIIPAKFGGKPCSNNLKMEEIKECSKAETVASYFLSSLKSEKAVTSSRSMMMLSSQVLTKPVCPEVKFGDKIIAAGACRNPNTRRKRDAGSKKRDVLMLLDESGSVGKINYQLEKNAAAAMVIAFQGDIRIGSDKTRVAMATFDQVNHEHFDFDSYFDKPQLTSVIKGASYSSSTSGSTCMAAALEFARDEMFTTGKGMRVGKDYEKLIIMITDGCANCASVETLKKIRSSLNDKDTSVLTLHIGPIANCLDKLKALSDGSRCFQMYNMENWKELIEFTQYLENAILSWDSWQDFDSACKPIKEHFQG